ncbi:hypothetical protein [Marinobacter xestospongiae]|uniref:hypothetical protein n=1 Tax=Marinobacter xestospongiae TaxID=994319 RepID=UPI00200360F7|nr:hypothetical protein [Marinobacter xestospongiae]MCK7565526.1 hypothetical protein [Marinobacter xestospongiae]
MPKLPRNTVAEHLDEVRSWEDFFGVDYPGYLPYWVAYMSSDERYRYLLATRSEYRDFQSAMLKPGFDWASWVAICPYDEQDQHGTEFQAY